ncbi:MAG: hypothetical protein ACRENE_26680, partial [Polyangiaceae bacterium]
MPSRSTCALGLFLALPLACSVTEGHPHNAATSAAILADDATTRESLGTGTVGMHLLLVGGVALDSLDWDVSNGTNDYKGILELTDDAGLSPQSAEFVAGPVVAGSGYVVTLTGVDGDGDPCSGASPAGGFTVPAGTEATAQVTVLVTCTVPTDATVAAVVDSASVAVDAGVTVVNQPPWQCPAIAGVAITPADLPAAGTASLTASILPGSGGTETFQWSASCPSGTPYIVHASSPSAAFE